MILVVWVFRLLQLLLQFLDLALQVSIFLPHQLLLPLIALKHYLHLAVQVGDLQILHLHVVSEGLNPLDLLSGRLSLGLAGGALRTLTLRVREASL